MKVGDYVRTKYGIAKIIQDGDIILEENGNRTIYVDKNGIAWENQFAYYVWSNDIIKSSPNIIDLIEVGDYVNGHKVTAFMYDGKNNRIGVVVDSEQWAYDNNEIKSIVTKEQFESMEYRL